MIALESLQRVSEEKILAKIRHLKGGSCQAQTKGTVRLSCGLNVKGLPWSHVLNTLSPDCSTNLRGLEPLGSGTSLEEGY